LPAAPIDPPSLHDALPISLGTEVWDLTRAEWIGRRQMRQIAAFLRKYVPGFEDAYVMQSGVQVGVRETRRIQGEYRLTAADILRDRKSTRLNSSHVKSSYA